MKKVETLIHCETGSKRVFLPDRLYCVHMMTNQYLRLSIGSWCGWSFISLTVLLEFLLV